MAQAKLWSPRGGPDELGPINKALVSHILFAACALGIMPTLEANDSSFFQGDASFDFRINLPSAFAAFFLFSQTTN